MSSGPTRPACGTGIPALADNPNMADKTRMIEVLVNGRGGMPWFTDMLTPQQIAAVLTYVRSNHNAYADQRMEQVARAGQCLAY